MHLEQGDGRRDDRAAIGIIRVQRDLSKQATIGLLATSRDFANSSNRVGSVDMRIQFHSNWVVAAQAARSDTRILDGNRVLGSSLTAEVVHWDRHVLFASRYADRSSDFRAELGFVPRVGVRQIDHYIGYRWRPEESPLQIVTVGGYVLFDWDRNGRLQHRFLDPNINFNFARSTWITFVRFEELERFEGVNFNRSRNAYTFNTEWLKWLKIRNSFQHSADVNFIPAAGLKPFLAGSINEQFTLTLRPKAQIRFDSTYIYSRLAARETTARLASGARPSIFNNHLVRSKVNIQFNRELSVRAIVDYRAVLPNNDLIRLERLKRFTADILVTYLVNPGTALYIGYTDNSQELGVLPSTGIRSREFVSTGKQFFLKMSYLFRF